MKQKVKSSKILFQYDQRSCGTIDVASTGLNFDIN